MNDPTMAKIEIITDGGPWAIHNFPCPVCGERKAILFLHDGTFTPCPVCQDKGWELVQWKRPFWSKMTRWLRR